MHGCSGNRTSLPPRKEADVKYKDKNLATYPEIIDYALGLEGAEQEAFVEAYAQTGPHALANVGYFSGYYENKTADRIMEVFKTAHPIFGRRHPSAEEALRQGAALAEREDAQLEALIAIHVMKLGADEGDPPWRSIPKYMSSLTAAFEVIEKVGSGMLHRNAEFAEPWLASLELGRAEGSGPTWQEAWRKCVVEYLKAEWVEVDD